LSNGVFNAVANSRKVTQFTEVAASNHVALVDGHIGKPVTAAKIVETALFKSPAFAAAPIALSLYFCGFSIFLPGTALFMQDVWHFSALRAGVGIAPAPIVAIVFAVSAGPIQRRFGLMLPAVVGSVAMAVAALYWIISVHAQPAYWSEMFPALVIMGRSGGLSPDRATTGSAVLNMIRQIGSAVEVAVLIAPTANGNPVNGFDHAWGVQTGVGLLAAGFLLGLREHRAS
jgi:hypothetical protein